jgi:hypothetical protein
MHRRVESPDFPPPACRSLIAQRPSSCNLAGGAQPSVDCPVASPMQCRLILIHLWLRSPYLYFSIRSSCLTESHISNIYCYEHEQCLYVILNLYFAPLQLTTRIVYTSFLLPVFLTIECTRSILYVSDRTPGISPLRLVVLLLNILACGPLQVIIGWVLMVIWLPV